MELADGFRAGKLAELIGEMSREAPSQVTALWLWAVDWKAQDKITADIRGVKEMREMAACRAKALGDRLQQVQWQDGQVEIDWSGGPGACGYFSLQFIDENGDAITLEQFQGKKVVLYFYPKDMTPGCTMQSCNLRDNYQILLDNGYVVLGCSADSPERHQKFIAKHDLPFSLISDESKEVLNAYGVWGPKKFMGKEYDGINRTSFVIDENGIIEDIISKVKTKEHTAQIIK